ncbi:MAG: hypothetical protein K8T90_00330 [Planctomycetes bacterium]|nr:hypothetical protein [Planctomycetota bacterium]
MNNRRDGVLEEGRWARASTKAKLSTGVLAAMAVSAAWGIDGDAHAARQASTLKVLKVNVMSLTNVPANQIVEVTFSADIDPGTVSPASVQVRAQNATGTGYTKQVFGSFQVAGNLIRFFPRLPGHLRDASGKFYTAGSPQDDATENAGFHAGTNYEIRMIGNPLGSPIRAATGRPLNRSTLSRFTIATASSPSQLYTTRSYSDSPPPQFAFSNPPDTVPIPETQYATRGGTKGVPNEIDVQIYCTRVPLSPTTARVPGNVSMTMLERYGDANKRRPAPGTTFIEQNFETTLMVYKPTFPLADQGLYALRVSKNLKDLTEQYDFQPNRERDRLRRIYEFLSTQRANNPGANAADLPDPPASLIGDWPPVTDTAARGVLKTNMLALGDAHPDEIDPRTMVIFTTRDEPVTSADFRIDFLKSENLFDPTISTAEWDLGVPGAASAIFTVAGGSAVDGDLLPTTNVTLNPALVPNFTFNFRDVVIPQGVTVSFTSTTTRPVSLLAINFTLNGVISLPGQPGLQSSEGSTSVVAGGLGGPGGGQGGSASYASTNNLNPSNAQRASGITGPSGKAGVDSDGGNPSTFGGGGGLGGKMASGTYYGYSGGGGGGGARLAGKAGGAGTAGGGTFGASWNGAGGNGGAGSSNVELKPLVGGGGGGVGPGGGFGYGGTNGWGTSSWFGNGGSGGGGGGAILIQTAKVLTIGSTGAVRAIGGKGANQLSYNGGASGPGGGGGGGSVLLRSTGGFNILSAAPFDVSGGAGGSSTSGYPTSGGAGGTGFIRTEEPTGVTTYTPANGTTGTFDPVGGGVASFVYSKWADIGVQDPRILPWTNADIATNPTTNDAVYVMVQMTKEDSSVFGTPDVSKVDALQNSKDTKVTSNWLPIKIHDKTGLPGKGAFSPPGYDPSVHGLEYSGFPVTQLNNLGYRFIRFRIYFQLDSLQQRVDPMPSVDFITTHVQFNL